MRCSPEESREEREGALGMWLMDEKNYRVWSYVWSGEALARSSESHGNF